MFFGDTVHVETTCQEKVPGRRSGKVIWLRRLLNQSNQVVQQGVFETLVAVSPVVPKNHLGSAQHMQHRDPSGGTSDRAPGVNTFMDKPSS